MDVQILESYKKAGSIAAQALEYGKTLIKPGNSLKESCDKIEEKIIELGGGIAFPAQISLNDTAAHFCPDADDEIIFKDQVCCLDVGAHIDGYIGDNACTIDLSEKNDELVKASRDALNNALKIIRPGITTGEIGKVIEDTITSMGFQPIRNLSGHGLSQYNIHDEPSIPNFDTKEETILEEDDVIAIEPFATDGIGMIGDKGEATVFCMMNKKPVRMPFVREILKQIESYDHLPFTKRWLTEKQTLPKVNLAMNQLKALSIIKGYPPLVEARSGIITQAEHSLIVKEKSIILTQI